MENGIHLMDKFLFLRKLLNHKKMVQTKVNFEIIPYNVARKAEFKTLNIEWITKYFKVEPEDERVLDFSWWTNRPSG